MNSPSGRLALHYHVSAPSPAGCSGMVLLAWAVFAVLMVVGLGQRCLWTDEMISLGHVADTEHFRDPFHPPGYYWLLYVWVEIFGRSDLALRAFSVPWAILAFAFALALAARVLQGRELGLFAWLFALSPFLLLSGGLTLRWAAGIWAFKAVAEYRLFSRAARFFQRPDLRRFFPLWMLVQPLHIAVVGMLGCLGIFTWKGQRHRWGRREKEEG